MKSLKEAGFAVFLATIGAVSQPLAASKTGGALQTLDTDHDGTIDMNETKSAAATLFDRLDRDHDGTLSARELRGRMSVREFAAADLDHDGTLTKEEFAAAVEKRFKAANRDSDDTLDGRELAFRPGHALLRLVR
jgi:Ca2+-binding EF-hand superfamily protein